ncbi:MAG: hypothetical protein COA47_12905 [Robiginitomaculum sp.]|nr:MAG: hypothetical protein COA47_12905 [Robiginitomaculum sp.]
MTESPNKLRQLHKLSALVLLVFVTVHLGNHLSGWFGIDAYNQVQKALRVVYRFPPIEVLLLGLMGVQILLGATLLFKSLRRGRPRGFWSWAQILSGGVFLFFVVEHLWALYMARIAFQLETDFSWPASVMGGAPFTLYFIPYYFLGVFALLTHVGTGVRYWVMDAGHPKAANRVAIGFMLAGAVIGAAIIPVLTGALYDIPLKPEWLEYLRYFYPEYMPPA